MHAIPSPTPRTAFGPPFIGFGRQPIVLTAASGLWTPPRDLARVMVIATGPGAAGTGGSGSGGAGGTAIGFVDLAALSGEPIAYTVGQQNTSTTTAILGLSGNAGSGLAAGAASGGSLMNLKGGCGTPLPLGSYSFSAAFSGGPVSFSSGFAQGGYQNGTLSLNTSQASTLGSAPGGASYWGGCDGWGAHSTTYGVGGYADANTGWRGGPGVIMIMGG